MKTEQRWDDAPVVVANIVRRSNTTGGFPTHPIDNHVRRVHDRGIKRIVQTANHDYTLQITMPNVSDIGGGGNIAATPLRPAAAHWAAASPPPLRSPIFTRAHAPAHKHTRGAHTHTKRTYTHARTQASTRSCVCMCVYYTTNNRRSLFPLPPKYRTSLSHPDPVLFLSVARASRSVSVARTRSPFGIQ